MNSRWELGKEFEDLCARIFGALGYSVDREINLRDDHISYRVDFLIHDHHQTTPRPVEVKLISATNISLRLLRNVAASVSKPLRQFGVEKPILIVSANVDNAVRKWIEKEYSLELWDRKTLFEKAQSVELYAAQLEDLYDAIDSRIATNKEKSEAVEDAESERDNSARFNSVIEPPQYPLNYGSELCADLQAVPYGKEGAKDFEKICEKIIEYIFGAHLIDCQSQSRLEDGLSILDLIYRVRSGHFFWENICRDFRARIIVFECKNYTEKVSPREVYTTERYVYPVALRSVCFMLTRKGAHEHAVLAAAGAMRETGKLIIFLSDNDLCDMLQIRDAQLSKIMQKLTIGHEDDPTEILDQKIFKFLSQLGR